MLLKSIIEWIKTPAKGTISRINVGFFLGMLQSLSCISSWISDLGEHLLVNPVFCSLDGILTSSVLSIEVSGVGISDNWSSNLVWGGYFVVLSTAKILVLGIRNAENLSSEWTYFIYVYLYISNVYFIYIWVQNVHISESFILWSLKCQFWQSQMLLWQAE